MTTPEDKCYLCGRQLPNYLTPYAQTRMYEVNCQSCGTYQVPFEFASEFGIRPPTESFKISAYVRERALRKMPAPILVSHPVQNGPLHGIITIDSIKSEFPKTVAERLDRTLLNLARMSSQPGARVTLDSRFDYAVAFSENGDAFDFVLSQLGADGYVNPPGGWPGNVTLTVKGWSRVAELERGLWGPLSKQVFVAMSFDNSLDDAWASGFKPGIEDCKYDPLRVDLKQHNEKICDVIVAEIRKSKFLVADFTLHRNGVYFEAGLMMGLGRPVIFTCRMDELGRAHFDTRQYNHIAWESPAQLREQLKQRIQATIIT